jgi:hypothetical protein
MKTEDGKIEQAGCAPMPSDPKTWGKHKLGDGMSRPSWRLSFLGDPGANFFCGLIENVVGAVGKVKIPMRCGIFKWSGKVLPLDFSTERLFPPPLYPRTVLQSRK